MKEVTFNDIVRMCNFYPECTDCPFHDLFIEDQNCMMMSVLKLNKDGLKIIPKIANIINEKVEKWTEQHPKKTRAMRLKELFPKASTEICPQHICGECLDDKYSSCGECIENYWNEEIYDDNDF